MVRPLLRRELLASVAAIYASAAGATTIKGKLPWSPDAPAAPRQVGPGPWLVLSPEEGAALEAMVDRIIPPDAEFAGGREAGCALFIDRQLAGPYGSQEGLYRSPPFADGLPTQGMQSPITPAQTYKIGLPALDRHCQAAFAGKRFRDLGHDQQDAVLEGLEKGQIRLEGIDARRFFGQVMNNAIEGFFADPVYGGNRDMVGWRMIGFPGARYDYRDWVSRHNEPYPHPPVGITGRPAWLQN